MFLWPGVIAAFFCTLIAHSNALLKRELMDELDSSPSGRIPITRIQDIDLVVGLVRPTEDKVYASGHYHITTVEQGEVIVWG